MNTSNPRPLTRKRFIKEIVMELVKPAAADPPQVAAQHVVDEEKHVLNYLPGRGTRVCPVCGKRSSWFCPGCNCGSHPKCFSQLKHFWRPLKGVKRPQEDESSESE